MSWVGYKTAMLWSSACSGYSLSSVYFSSVVFTAVCLKNYGFFAPLPVRPLACSPPGSFAPWLVRLLACLPPGWFAPGLFARCARLIRPLACSPSGSFAFWLVHRLADLPFGLFAPWLYHPLVEYIGDSLLWLVFQFTERQQESVASRHWLIVTSINVISDKLNKKWSQFT